MWRYLALTREPPSGDGSGFACAQVRPCSSPIFRDAARADRAQAGPGPRSATPEGVQVRLEPRTCTPVLLDARCHDRGVGVPWWGGRQLTYSFPPA